MRRNAYFAGLERPQVRHMKHMRDLERYNGNGNPESLRDLNKFLATFTKWQAVRSRSGYYYFVQPNKVGNHSVYVFNCRSLTFAQWKQEIETVEG